VVLALMAPGLPVLARPRIACTFFEALSLYKVMLAAASQVATGLVVLRHLEKGMVWPDSSNSETDRKAAGHRVRVAVEHSPEVAEAPSLAVQVVQPVQVTARPQCCPLPGVG
jgi:hypothetical protein